MSHGTFVCGEVVPATVGSLGVHSFWGFLLHNPRTFIVLGSLLSVAQKLGLCIFRASSVPRPVSEAEKKQQVLICPPPERKASPEQLKALVAAMSLLEAPV